MIWCGAQAGGGEEELAKDCECVGSLAHEHLRSLRCNVSFIAVPSPSDRKGVTELGQCKKCGMIGLTPAARAHSSKQSPPADHAGSTQNHGNA